MDGDSPVITNDPQVIADDPSTNTNLEKEETLTPKTGWGKRLRFSPRRVDKTLSRVVSIVFRSILVAMMIIGIIFVIRQLSNSNYSMEQISVPRTFEEAGYTGHSVANRIFNRVNSVIKNERLADVAKEYENANAVLDLNVEVVGIGVPIRSLTMMLGETMGIDNRRPISGNLSVDGDTLVFELNIDGDVEKFYALFNSNIENSMAILVTHASEAILKHTNPYVLARYYLLRNADGCFKLGKYILNRHQDDPNVEPIGYFAMAGGHVTLRQFEVAEQIVRKGVEKYPTDLNLHAALSTILQRQRKYDEAIAQCKRVISMLDDDTPINRISRSYENLASIMEDLNKPDSAIYYAKIAVDRDPDFAEARAFIGIQYYAKQDTASAIQHWTSAFDKGLQVSDFERMMNNHAHIYILEDPRVIDLIRRYHNEH